MKRRIPKKKTKYVKNLENVNTVVVSYAARLIIQLQVRAKRHAMRGKD